MAYLTYINSVLTFRNIQYQITDITKSSEVSVFVSLQNEEYNSIIAFVANETTINDILQTSADMIIETLTNG